ncbi:hypothetical protein J4H86_20675 [Spiractinospora alimapuensis]|uniref:hypothetical protein n=1 Tax=Spiractinospora alimapuensis TaxID=2820884 RepID=UPI001F1D9CB4|nr:hypothetical protein [Spiractinospora alimapuensis]QVQ51216.1 hypothetical protein J4H86_20675 [Spiractinospora alimapuensis]
MGMLGDYPNEPPPQYPVGGPQRGNRAIGITVAVLGGLTLVLTVIVVIVLVLRLQSSDEGTTADDIPIPPVESEESASEEGPEDADDDEEDEPESDENARVSATIEGWQGVAAQRRPLEYDVPSDWIIESPGMLHGFEEEDPDAPFGYSPRVTMSGVSYFPSREDGCEETGPGSGKVGSSGMGEMVDTASGAEAMATEWAEAAYEHDDGAPQLSAAEVSPFEANGLEGHIATVDVVPSAADCYPESAQVNVASVEFPDENDVYNFILYADTSGSVAPEADDVETILTTLRPQDGWVDPDD